MKYKIIQIIPIHKNITATYYSNCKKEDDIKLPVVCLALIEYEDDSREVQPMDMDEGGDISFVFETGNLKYVKCGCYDSNE